MFPNRVQTDSDTPSPEPLAKREDSIHPFIYSFIHSFVYVCRGPQKGALLIHTGKNIRSPSTESHADGKPTYTGLRPGSARGLLTTLLSLPHCHAAFGTIPSTLAWVDQSLAIQRVSYQPPSGYTLHNCYRLPRDPG